MKPLYCSVLLSLLTTLAIPTSTIAQSRIEGGPLVALYAPVGGFASAPYYSVGLPNAPSDLSGLAFGAQGRVWFNGRLGIQLELATASSHVGGGNTPAGPISSRAARVLTVAGQVLVGLNPLSQRARVWLSAGPGLVRHAGQAYAPYGSPTQFATTVGLGATIPFSSHLRASAGITTFLYNLDVSDSSGTSLEHGFQVDPLLHLGLSIQ